VQSSLPSNREFTDLLETAAAGSLSPGKLRLWGMTLVEIAASPTKSAPPPSSSLLKSAGRRYWPFLLRQPNCDVDKLTDVAWSLFGQTPLAGAGTAVLRLGAQQTSTLATSLPARSRAARRLPASGQVSAATSITWP